MKKILLLCLALTGPLAHAQDMKPPPVPQAPEAPKNFTAAGERVDVPGAGFSMIPPSGWEVLQGESGTSLLFQAPKPQTNTKEFTYQANIRVMAFFDKPTAIDDIAKEEWSKTITEKMTSISNRTDEFALLSAEKVKLQSGSDAILFYSSFKYDSVQMMQMHILVSNAKNTFLMTYTDLGKVFEAQDAALTTAYTSMHSAQLDSVPAPRFQMMIFAGAGVGALLLLLILIRVVRGWRVSKMGDGMDDDSDSKGSGTTDYGSSVSMVTEIDTSAMSRKRRERDRDDDDEYEDKPKKKAKARHVEEEVEEVEEVEEEYSAPVSEIEEEYTPPAPVPAPAPKKAAPAPTPAPAPVAKKAVNAPAPAQAPAPKAQKVPSPKPNSMTAAPTSKSFENRKRKDTVIPTVSPATQTQMPMSQASNAALNQMPVSEVANWNLPDPNQADEDVPLSEVMKSNQAPLSEVQEFVKKEKTKSSGKRAPEEDEDEMQMDEESEVARLSEILPRGGDDEKPKKRGFFSWGKKKEEELETTAKKGNKKPSKSMDDDEAPVSAVSDAWAVDSKKKVGKSKDEQPVSEVADWALNEGGGDVGADDDDEDNK